MGTFFGGMAMYNIVDRKSLDQYREVWINLASNQRYAKYVDEMDKTTFVTRLANEGVAFLTRTLPTIGRALDAHFSLARKGLKFDGPSEFSKSEDGIPHFLGMAIRWGLEGDSVAIDCVRQLTYIFYKLEVDYDQDTEQEFLDQFERIDQELAAVTKEMLDNNPDVAVARALVARILCNVDPHDIRPRHGGGATACRTVNHEKWHRLRYYPKLDAEFSYPDYFFYSLSHLSDDYELLKESVESDPMARVCLVPKDSRGPRIISCEPAELMYIQQGLMRKLYKTLETHHLTKGYINFVDQGVNQQLAHESSLSGHMATLDLSDASDRVSMNLIRALLPQNWVDALGACRSERTKLPGGRVIELQKFAPMGSSCCFPVEALVFWAIASACICRLERGVTAKLFPIYVYGDDIVVPAGFAGTIISGLESVGLKVNLSKSFVEGPFRESCGGDYHNGYDVTPVRVRKAFGSSSSSIVTDADLANLFIAKFGEKDGRSLVGILDEANQSPFPRSAMQLPGCITSGHRACNDVHFQRRWNKNLQRYEYRIRRVFAKALARREPNWFELLRKELTRGDTDSTPDKYANSLLIQERALKPGYYIDSHSITTKWEWTWLG
jgi:hypothetical protein